MRIPFFLKEILATGLFILLIFLFLFGNEQLIFFNGSSIPSEWRSIFIIFLGILLEALPFILLGAVASSVIQIYMSGEMIKKMIPKNPVAAGVVALVAAVITPVCECAIIPVVRRLIQKGVPVHAGAALLCGAPILNFVVFASTFYAFPIQPQIYLGRFILCMITALITSFFVYLYFAKQPVFRTRKEDLLGSESSMGIKRGKSKWKGMLHHCANEFFSVGKYFIAGAALASVAQTYFQASAFAGAASVPIVGTGFMMGTAFLLSLCSEADAFVAASFEQWFLPEAILGFLVYGPILDLKNTFVMFASFKLKFVFFYIFIVTVVIFSLCLMVGIFF
ncbi:permease [Bacillaceae bacterium Marseille-Q3522]|nr:permease [Bacillaceae bacterium Marseille-Q3522]